MSGVTTGHISGHVVSWVHTGTPGVKQLEKKSAWEKGSGRGNGSTSTNSGN